ncbi:Cytochrome P450 monooxygenase 98 [Psilocybe cubensis]|uniref:Cytochrome P450 monooxygenase 98 n=1 Tax=Psilocybe cubensis TaxID=181762 RepID=A0ACB8GQ54_PSICU|nr:Cytochrome P450 monooxygenase 98 [Psilocybe cubensis]KAH9477688.1 Cytochrome P450 monooxygenase 98 [Psilocybe cubensis]
MSMAPSVPALDTFASLAFLCISALYLKARWKSSRLPLPPGPKGYPIIGNLLDMPHRFEWEVYHRWCKDFDTDILHLNAGGTHIIVLDSYRAAQEVLERKSTINSGRPRLPMVNELMGLDFNFGFMDYGICVRRSRRLMHHAFHPSAAKQYRPQEINSARRFLRRLLDDQDDIMGELRLLSGEAVLSSTYGIEIASKHDKYITIAEDGTEPVLTAIIPGTFLVDFIPALKYVPEWFPGAEFKRKAREWRQATFRMRDVPYEDAKREIERGTPLVSFCSMSLGKIDERLDRDAQEEDIKSVAATLYGAYTTAGADSVMAAVATCILALLNHPDVFKKAQAQIDSVVKPGRLPDFDDEASLPFVTAIIKESMRWREVTPLGLPHRASAESEYNGYRIPKGSIIMANSWAMLHDETVYPEPFAFKPERFLTNKGQLNKSVKDPGHAIWGFGRRICPGRYMAASSVWITVASFISAFDIARVDESGGLDHEYGSGIIRIPLPFKCSIRPRSKAIEDFIRSTTRE